LRAPAAARLHEHDRGRVASRAPAEIVSTRPMWKYPIPAFVRTFGPPMTRDARIIDAGKDNQSVRFVAAERGIAGRFGLDQTADPRRNRRASRSRRRRWLAPTRRAHARCPPFPTLRML